jgi:hypothetical protein
MVKKKVIEDWGVVVDTKRKTMYVYELVNGSFPFNDKNVKTIKVKW